MIFINKTSSKQRMKGHIEMGKLGGKNTWFKRCNHSALGRSQEAVRVCESRIGNDLCEMISLELVCRRTYIISHGKCLISFRLNRRRLKIPISNPYKYYLYFTFMAEVSSNRYNLWTLGDLF